MPRTTRMLATLAIALAMFATTARAQQPAAVDPAAVAALTSMSAYLRGLKSFQVESVTATDDVLDDGQVVQHVGKVTFLVQMPNKLMADASSDRSERSYFYDGTTFTLLARRVGYYATVPAPATVAELDTVLSDKYDIELPLADLFRFGSARWNPGDIKGALDVGPGEVGGATCEHYAFRQGDIDWQIWIQKGEFPLPRKIVIRTTSDPARPQYAAMYTWNLAPSFNSQSFTFVPPRDAKKIVLATADQATSDQQ